MERQIIIQPFYLIVANKWNIAPLTKEWCLDLKRLTKPSFNLHLEILRFFVPFKLIIGNVGLSCSSNMLLLVLYEIYAIIVFSRFV